LLGLKRRAVVACAVVCYAHNLYWYVSHNLPHRTVLILRRPISRPS
jgi:hypothetical protein